MRKNRRAREASRPKPKVGQMSWERNEAENHSLERRDFVSKKQQHQRENLRFVPEEEIVVRAELFRWRGTAKRTRAQAIPPSVPPPRSTLTLTDGLTNRAPTILTKNSNFIYQKSRKRTENSVIKILDKTQLSFFIFTYF